MSSSERKTDSIAEQLDILLNSNMPEEYKAILRNFQQQGLFYTEFIQQNHNNKELTPFWNLADTLGFKSFNDSQTSEREQTQNTLLRALNDVQTSLIKMTALQTTLSQRAAEIFQSLQKSGTDSSSEQVCQHWLQAGEQAFSELSQGEEYQQAQQRLFESIKQLGRAQQQLYAQCSSYLGLPSQQSISDLQKGLHQLRNDFAEYKEHSEATIKQLSTSLQKFTQQTVE